MLERTKKKKCKPTLQKKEAAIEFHIWNVLVFILKIYIPAVTFQLSMPVSKFIGYGHFEPLGLIFIVTYGAKSSLRLYKPFILLFCRLFKCCGWTLSWTHLLPWPWPLRCQLLNYCYENPMAVQRPLFRGQWPKIFSDKPYTSSSSHSEWCFTVRNLN